VKRAARAAIGLGVLVLLGTAWLATRAPGGPSPSPRAPLARDTMVSPRPADASAPMAPATVAPAPLAPRWHDPLIRTSDLYAAYRRLRTSGLGSERADAWRAWSSCTVFAGSEAPAPEAVAKGFSETGVASQRLEALRVLQARCAGFADETAAESAAMEAMHARGQATSHGDAARALLDVGDRDGALRHVAEAAASGDPQEIRDLSGLVERFRRDAAEGESQPPQPLRDAALAVVACDLGLDCAADSLWATRLCALHGECRGDLVERTLAGFNALDRRALQAERDALASQLRGGHFDLRGYVQGR